MLRLATVLLLVAGCGRTGPYDDATDAGAALDAGSVDSGRRDAGTIDAGTIDAGAVDAGAPPPLCPPASPTVGRVWGTSPLGAFDFRSVWTGTEGPWSHSCPHVTVFASAGPAPDRSASLTVDFHFGKPPMLGASSGLALLTLNGKTSSVAVTAKVTRADGLTMSTTPEAQWRTTLSFQSDAGWPLEGTVLEAPNCGLITWYCL